MEYKVVLLKNVEIYILVDDVIGSYIQGDVIYIGRGRVFELEIGVKFSYLINNCFVMILNQKFFFKVNFFFVMEILILDLVLFVFDFCGVFFI